LKCRSCLNFAQTKDVRDLDARSALAITAIKMN
jgi:hypothetical protein